MLFIWLPTACTINGDDHSALQDLLRDTSDVEETVDISEIDNTKYAFFEPNGCIEFESTQSALGSTPWSFSFLFTKDMVEENTIYNMFQVEGSRILLFLKIPSSYLLFCEPVDLENIEESETLCTQVNIDFRLAPAPKDRFSISLSEEGTMTIYHNDGLVGEADGVENTFPERGPLSFGCPIPEEQNIFVEPFSSWQGGIDSLFLFDQSFSENQINSLYEAEVNMYLWENLDQYIIDSYWSLGEDEGNTVRDAIGSNNGKTNPMVIFREH